MPTVNNSIIQNDKIVRWPKRPKDKDFVILWLSKKFYVNSKFKEKEVNAIINNHHSFNDIALLRRELVSRGYLNRKDDGSEYWL